MTLPRTVSKMLVSGARLQQLEKRMGGNLKCREHFQDIVQEMEFLFYFILKYWLQWGTRIDQGFIDFTAVET